MLKLSFAKRSVRSEKRLFRLGIAWAHALVLSIFFLGVVLDNLENARIDLMPALGAEALLALAQIG